MKIYKKEDKLVVEFPLIAKRSNPYDDEYKADMPAIVGVIAGDDIGFCWNIDMEYKGKEDQHSDFFLQYPNEEKQFIELCDSLGIEWIKYPVCYKCYKPIYGCHTMDKIGDICFSCEKK